MPRQGISPCLPKGMGLSVRQGSGTFLGWSLCPRGGRGTEDLAAPMTMLM